MRKLLTTILLLFALSSFGQIDSVVAKNYSKAKDMMLIEEFSRANNYFIKALNQGEILPDDLCFHFGKNLYLTGYYRVSTDFLNKYISLKDSSGQHVEEALIILNSIHEILEEKNKTSDDHIEELCEEGQHITCPVCNGTGVIKTRNSFGDVYNDCPYSNSQGLMKCSGYQEYLKGNLIDYDEQ